MYCSQGRSPGAVLGYVSLNLLMLMRSKLVQANVAVIDVLQHNSTIWEAPDLPARFGEPLPEDGIWGHLVDIASEGCDEKTFKPAPPEMDKHWIALIKRGVCQFDQKVLNAQRKKYYAAIVYNDEADTLIPMGGGTHAAEISIPSVFVGRDDALKFKKLTDPEKYVYILDLRMNFNYWPLMKDFLIIASAAFAFGLFVGLAVLVIRWIRDVRHRRRSRLSRANLKKIPIKKFKKGDPYDVCAICLDEYEDGEKLRILPCSHAYHQKCIDPWLTKNKKVCPICKRKVIPGDEHDSDSDSDSDEENGHSENTPLLGATARNDSPLRPTRGGTFDNSGLPPAVRNQGHPLSFEEYSSDDDYSLSTSNYQSSVEVHSSVNHGNRGTIVMVTDSESEETESADSDTEPLVAISGPEASTGDPLVGGLDNPAIVVVDDHFNADDGTRALVTEEVPVAVIDSVDDISSHGRDQIV